MNFKTIPTIEKRMIGGTRFFNVSVWGLHDPMDRWLYFCSQHASYDAFLSKCWNQLRFYVSDEIARPSWKWVGRTDGHRDADRNATRTCVVFRRRRSLIVFAATWIRERTLASVHYLNYNTGYAVTILLL